MSSLHGFLIAVLRQKFNIFLILWVVRVNSSVTTTLNISQYISIVCVCVRYHRGERAGRSAGHGDSVPHADSQAYGLQELSGQEPGGSGDPGIYQHHLLRQDWHTHAEPYDCRAHVVWQPDHRGGHHWGSVWCVDMNNCFWECKPGVQNPLCNAIHGDLL